MTQSILRDTLFMCAVVIAIAVGLSHRETVYKIIGLDLNPAESQQSEAAQADAEATPTSSPSSAMMVSIRKSRRDGHFWTEARVNRGVVKFLVDTGASAVALTPEDAKKAGIRLRDLDYNIPISTAGGRNMAAEVELDVVAIGAISIRDVRALVVPEGLQTSLLGMSFLGQLQKVEVTPNAMVLRR